MTRWLVLAAVLVTAAFVAIIVWPRDSGGGSTSSPAGGASQPQAGTGRPASFTVLVDGQEIQERDEGSEPRMADLPASSWNSAMVSHIRAIGNSQVLVFVDGSEALIDGFTRDRLPADVAYRAGYDRD